MKRVMILLAGLLLLCIAIPAGAQIDLVIDTLQVQLWPEYDRPSMLVIYSLELSADQSLPVEVSVRIPQSVGEPTAVAVLENTTLVTRDYTRTVDGDWAVITLETDSSFIQIEYYDTALSQQDQPRTYDFRWLSDYNVNAFSISVKQPLTATGMQITPNLGSGVVGSDGLTNFSSALGPWPTGQSFELSLSYNKSDTALVVQNPQQPATAPQGPQSTSITDQFPPWVWVLLGLGVVVLVVGGIFYFRSSRSDSYSGNYKRKKQQARGRGKTRPGSVNKSGVYCHQCGTQAFARDKFCRECGTKLRL